jgi:hypothetical protein
MRAWTPATIATNDVDFVINCYERTYRQVLRPGFVAELAASQKFEFASVTVLINNVLDYHEANRLRLELLASDQPPTRVEFVKDHLEEALTATGLRPRHLRRLPHFTDCCLVAAVLPGPTWFCYWDTDARLREPTDWITPVIDYMNSHPSHGIGNPNNWHAGLAEREAIHREGDFVIGYGFSDVAFLARRADLARPIYRKLAPASWRFTLSHIEPVFEQRIDAWMRRQGRTRVTYLPATIDHVTDAGTNYPQTLNLRERIRRAAFRRSVPLAARLSRHPTCRNLPYPN